MKNLELINVEDVTNNLDLEHKKLYKVFPSNEIFPIENMKYACENDKYKILKFYEKKIPIGTAFISDLKEIGYIVISFLYVEKNMQNMGYGHKIIEKIKKEYANYNGIIVEIEPTNSLNQEKDNKRVKFYVDLGFEQINFKYKILQTDDGEYQKILLYVCNLKNGINYNYKYDEVKNILDEYYKSLFDLDYSNQYILN